MVIKFDKSKISFALAVIFMMIVCLSFFINKYFKAEETCFSIVMYHHISENKNMLGDYVITPEQFEQDIQYLKSKGYVSLSIQNLFEYDQKGKPLPKKSVMITFDDADESFLTYAYPVLKKYGMTAVLSVVGYYAEQYTKKAEPNIPFPYLDFEQIKYMMQSGIIELSNHTYHMHENKDGFRFGVKKLLNENDEDYKKALDEDISKFNELANDNLGFAPVIFTYPFGAMSEGTPSILKEMGFKALLTCREQKIYPNSSDDWLYSLGRYNRPYGKGSKEFFEKIL